MVATRRAARQRVPAPTRHLRTTRPTRSPPIRAILPGVREIPGNIHAEPSIPSEYKSYITHEFDSRKLPPDAYNAFMGILQCIGHDTVHEAVKKHLTGVDPKGVTGADLKAIGEGIQWHMAAKLRDMLDASSWRSVARDLAKLAIGAILHGISALAVLAILIYYVVYICIKEFAASDFDFEDNEPGIYRLSIRFTADTAAPEAK